LFNEAKAKPAGAERERFLGEACGGDERLKEQILSLLQAEAEDGDSDFLKNTVRISSAALVTEKPGDRIGRYKLLQQLGEGGCGVVYMAEQEEPVRRRVALKVIKLGMDTKSVIARFEAERQALALMDHPNIAKVLDAGATETGRPFFVMELVRGIKITDYCDQNNLTTEQRLELFRQVCHAIQHAHQKGIIHRDLKPSNILVMLHDGVPVPKVIDFGIAKATSDQRLTNKTVFTAFEQFIGTPAYMSPEQAEMSGLDIDTRSDIYSLGVLLYELLTGRTPLDANELLRSGMDEMRRKIREDEPPRPSTCLSTLQAADLTTIAKHRQADAPKLIHLLRGDLDWIVMKCLEKDRTRRYETANGLAMDLQRHLDNEPVTARPPSTGYRFQKLVRRNKLAFTAVAGVVTALVLGAVVSTWQAVRATRAEREQARQRREAQTQAAKATAISDLLQEMLRSANPDTLKGSEYTVRQLLDDFSAGLANHFEGQPEVEAAVRTTIGRAYHRLGFADKASAHLERALTLRRHIFGPQAEQVAETLKECAWSSFEQGQHAQAELHAREALEIYRKRGISNQRVISILFPLQRTLIMETRFAEADTVTEEAFAIAGKSGIESAELASMIHGLADVRNSQSRYPEAESLARKALEMHGRLHGAEHPETAWALFTLGVSLRNQQKLTEAEAALRESVRIFSKYYSPGYKTVDFAMNELKAVLTAKGDTTALKGLESERRARLTERNDPDPERTLREALATQRRSFGDKNLGVATSLFNLSSLLRKQGKLPEAESTAREALTIRQQLLGKQHAEVAQALHLLAWNLHLEGKHAEAEALSREELAIWRKLYGNEHPNVGWALGDLAVFLHDQAKTNEFEAVALEAITIYEKLAAKDPLQTDLLEKVGHDLWNLARVLDGNSQRGLTQRALQNSLAMFERGGRDFPGNPFFRQEQAFSHRLLGNLAVQLGKIDDAERHYRSAARLYAGLKSGAPQNVFYHQEEAYTTWMLAQILDRADRPESAFAEFRKALSFHEQAVVDFPANTDLKSRCDGVRAEFMAMLRRRVPLFEAAGQSERAAKWKKQLAELDQAEANRPAKDKK
jgi:serine/threonine protein kinase/tetratricopeptide (TPR) repeat protein